MRDRCLMTGKCSDGTGGGNECTDGGRVMSGLFALLEVQQAVVCGVSSLVAATCVLMLLVFLLTSRLLTLQSGK